MRQKYFMQRMTHALAGVAWGCVATAVAAATQTQTASLQLTANVLGSCSISTPAAINFGGDIAPTGATVQGISSVDIFCSPLLTYRVYAPYLVQDVNGQRMLKNPGGQTLAYSIKFGSSPLPDSSNTAIVGTGTGGSQTHALTADILGAIDKTVTPGAYGANLTLTVEYEP